MTTTQPNLLTREDTFFGVCQGLGEDLGIPPNLLRLTFALALFFNPLATIAAYAAAGALVASTRWLFPHPRAALAEVAAEPVTAAEVPLPLAA